MVDRMEPCLESEEAEKEREGERGRLSPPPADLPEAKGSQEEERNEQQKRLGRQRRRLGLRDRVSRNLGSRG